MVNITLLLNSLLVFLLLFEDRFQVPVALQVAGRMHPLLLHFPLVLIIIYALYNLFIAKQKDSDHGNTRRYADRLLLWGAFTAALSALMGLFLSKEEGYDTEALQWHKWWGVAVSLMALGWYYSRNFLRRRKITRWLSSAIAVTSLVIAGHAGAGITHGEDFLLAPVQSGDKKPQVPLADAMIYDHVILPILESKCMSCHNRQKAKGELVMETKELLLKGGKSGVVWDAAHPGPGLLVQRIQLPLEDKKHMPPRGKPQLTGGEAEMLQLWIEKGADFDLKLAGLPGEDRLYELASVLFETTGAVSYDFAAADPSAVRSLNSENRVVMEEALNSPALTVSFFNSNQFQSAQLRELSRVSDQIVSLDLTRMPVSEEDLKTISSFKNLRRLYLGFTSIKPDQLKWLKDLKHLESLTLSGTPLAAADLSVLKELPKLRQLYTWQTRSSNDEWQQLQKQWPGLTVETGFSGDTIRLKLSPPIFQHDEVILAAPAPLKLKHYINGAEIRYTLDGSEPDSINAPLYKGNEIIDRNVLIRARAFKPGWFSSDVMEASLYMRTFAPDTVIFLTKTEPAYPPDPKLLIDLIKGETNFRNGNWLAWRNNRMELLFQFNQAVKAESITISTLVDIDSYIMPPLYIEVWGGDGPDQLRKLGSVRPEQPNKMTPARLKSYECRFEASTVKYLKLIAQPVPELPSWHPGKGDKGWFFADEILVN